MALVFIRIVPCVLFVPISLHSLLGVIVSVALCVKLSCCHGNEISNPSLRNEGLLVFIQLCVYHCVKAEPK